MKPGHRGRGLAALAAPSHRHRSGSARDEISADEPWEQLLLAADYLFALFDGMNRFYVRAEDRQLISLLDPPINLFDACIPYELHRQVEDAQMAREAAERHKDSLEGSLAAAQGQLESIRAELDKARRALQTTLLELATAEGRLLPLRSLGPRALRVASWLHRVAGCHPRVAGLVRRVV